MTKALNFCGIFVSKIRYPSYHERMAANERQKAYEKTDNEKL